MFMSRRRNHKPLNRSWRFEISNFKFTSVAALLLIAAGIGILLWGPAPRVEAQIQRNADQVLSASFNAGPPASLNARDGQFNTTLPTLASGAFTALQTDVNGQLLLSPAGTPLPVTVNSASGATQLLATGVAATAGQSFTTTSFGQPKILSACLSSSAATTFTVLESIDGTTFFQGTLFGTAATSANFAPAAAGNQCESLVPAAFVRITTSAAVTVSIHVQASY